MNECIFCKIVQGDIPANKVYEDEKVVAFHDLEPQAPVHILLIPKKHIKSTDDISKEDEFLMGYMMGKVKEVAEKLELLNGYRVVINCGEDGMQTVKHMHMHILGKRKMKWPPG